MGAELRRLAVAAPDAKNSFSLAYTVCGKFARSGAPCIVEQIPCPVKSKKKESQRQEASDGYRRKNQRLPGDNR
jgi:hypothetical protein